MRSSRRRWYVYIARCRNGSYYTGMTGDPKRRLAEHNSGRGGRYTRSFGPVEMVWKEPHKTRASAMRREARIKRLSRAGKQRLVDKAP